MSTSVLEVFEKASILSDSDRALLAGLLIESLEVDTDEEAERAWMAEVERRVTELKSGSVQTIPWEEVKARLFSRADGT